MPCKYCQFPFSEQVVSQGQILTQQEGGGLGGWPEHPGRLGTHRLAMLLHSEPLPKPLPAKLLLGPQSLQHT